MDGGKIGKSVLPKKNGHEIREALEELVEANLEISVIVEGIKDERALRRIGCIGSILVFNRGESVTHFSESLARAGIQEVILLTDWDRHGSFLAERLSEALSSLEIKFDTDLRRRLSFYCKKYVMDVESLAGLLESIVGETIEKIGEFGEKEVVARRLEEF